MSIDVSKSSWKLGEDLTSEFDAEELFLINPNETTVKTIITSVFDGGSLQLRVLAEERVMNAAHRHFPFATKAAGLVDGGQVKIRAVDQLPRNSLILGPDHAIVLVTDTEAIFGIPTDSTDLVDSLNEGYEKAWTNAVQYDLRTPGLSTIRDTMLDVFDEEFLEEFDTTFESLRPIPRGENGIDEVVLLLLLTAKRRELLYDVAHWSEELNLASKATYSRTKRQLEEAGLIETEKVPIDVGRPRMRLRLVDEELQQASGESFIEKAREHIESDD